MKTIPLTQVEKDRYREAHINGADAHRLCPRCMQLELKVSDEDVRYCHEHHSWERYGWRMAHKFCGVEFTIIDREHTDGRR